LAQADGDRRREREGLTTDERDELCRLRRDNRVLREEREIAGEGSSCLRAGDRSAAMTYRLTEAEKPPHASPDSPARSVHERSGHHAWKRHRPTARSLADAAFAEHSEAIHEASPGIYCAPRIQAKLAGDHAICVGKTRVARPMRDRGIQGVAAEGWPKGEPSRMEAPAAPDLVRRVSMAMTKSPLVAT